MDETATALAVHDDLFSGTAPWSLRRGIEDALVGMADVYTLGKYELSRREVTLRGVFNRVHPKPVDADQEDLFERFMRGDLDDYPAVEPLASPNTWETVISERGNTQEAWETLIADEEYTLPISTSIRNLRNMLAAGVDEKLSSTTFSRRSTARAAVSVPLLPGLQSSATRGSAGSCR
jgi:60 kDa SS-A/Ro ribonucleoprotein